MKTNIAPARICAYKVLCDVLLSGAYSNISLNSTMNSSLKLPADRALCTNIVYGTIKKKARLEKVIRTLSKVEWDRIDTKERIILMMSLYQLFYLKKVPDYALINDAVSMASFYVGKGVTGYTNAILRSAQRERAALTAPEKDTRELLRYEYGFSDDLTKLLSRQYGEEELLLFAKASEQTPPLTVRVNTLKTDEKSLAEMLSSEGIEAETTWVPGTLRILSGSNVFATKAYRDGLFFAQDLSGAVCGYAMGFRTGDRVLDVCAAPGAKSFGAVILTGGGEVVSSDISRSKLDLVYRSASQMGMKSLRTRRSDATERDPALESAFDRVICDVPCSGLGVIRRKPEILYSMDSVKIGEISSLQERILGNVSGYVKPGGTLMYSTCTVNRDENEKRVEAFLSSHRDFRLAPIETGLSFPSEHPETKDGMLLLSPHRDGTDGFFMARLTREV